MEESSISSSELHHITISHHNKRLYKVTSQKKTWQQDGQDVHSELTWAHGNCAYVKHSQQSPFLTTTHNRFLKTVGEGNSMCVSAWCEYHTVDWNFQQTNRVEQVMQLVRSGLPACTAAFSFQNDSASVIFANEVLIIQRCKSTVRPALIYDDNRENWDSLTWFSNLVS